MAGRVQPTGGLQGVALSREAASCGACGRRSHAQTSRSSLQTSRRLGRAAPAFTLGTVPNPLRASRALRGAPCIDEPILGARQVPRRALEFVEASV